MSNITPWLVCGGIFLVMPGVSFALGFYLGRHGAPFTVTVNRNTDDGEGYGYGRG